MIRTIEFPWEGHTYHLLLNAAALFDLYDKFGDKGYLLDHIDGTGRKSFDATAWILVKLAQQGELLRRYQGDDPGPMLTYDAVIRTMSPRDMIQARDAIRRAYAAGFGRDVPPEDEEEEDLGLLELQKKTEVTSGKQSFFMWLRKFFGCQ